MPPSWRPSSRSPGATGRARAPPATASRPCGSPRPPTVRCTSIDPSRSPRSPPDRTVTGRRGRTKGGVPTGKQVPGRALSLEARERGHEGGRDTSSRHMEEVHRMKHRSLKLLTVLGVVALFASACQAATPSGGSGAPAAGGGSGSGPDGALVKRSDIKIEIVTHGQAQDGFWGVVRNGVK